jgi:O-succinylhomoserine sulfhydrylase
MSKPKQQFETKAIRAQMERTHCHEHAISLFLTSSFVFDTAEDLRAAFNEETDDFIYSSYGNPNTSQFVEKMAILEDTETGVAMASGMGAISTTFMALLKAGDHVVSCSSVFGAMHGIFTKFFPKWKIDHSYFDANKPEEIESLIKPEFRFIYLETPTNPAIEVIDIALVSAIAKQKGVLHMVNNGFASTYLQQPAALGADLEVHSATKYIDWQGRVLGGVVVGPQALIHEIYLFGRLIGPSISPFNAWMLSKSLETLSIRMEKHCSNALHLARSLENHAKLQEVQYPFLASHPHEAIARKQKKTGSGIVAFDVKGGYTAIAQRMDKLQMIKISPNLGDSRTIATHPASSTHCKLSEAERLALGITPGLIRISVGLEHQDDILDDLLQALEE